MQALLIDDDLLQAVRKVSGAGNERKITEALLREWLGRQKKHIGVTEEDEDAEWRELQHQKALYADKFPPSSIEPAGTPSFYKGRPLSIEEMREKAKRAVGERFKNA